MKKTLFFTSLFSLLLSISSTLGQQNASSQGKAIYQVSLQFDTPRIYDGELIFDEQSSVFIYDKDTYEGESDEERNEGGQIRRVINKGRSTDGIGLVIYSDFAKGTTVERDFIQRRPFVVSDTLRTIDWTLMDDTKEIEGIKCQKATATVYGREYEVWFSNTIPLPYGPWKLQGLPGLILEARSTDGEINFELKEIQQVVNDAQTTAPPTDGETMAGYANFYELQNKKATEMEKAFRARVAELQQSQGIGTSVTYNVGSAKVVRIEKSSTF